MSGMSSRGDIFDSVATDKAKDYKNTDSHADSVSAFVEWLRTKGAYREHLKLILRRLKCISRKESEA